MDGHVNSHFISYSVHDPGDFFHCAIPPFQQRLIPSSSSFQEGQIVSIPLGGTSRGHWDLRAPFFFKIQLPLLWLRKSPLGEVGWTGRELLLEAGV